jgi:hypothetical protein
MADSILEHISGLPQVSVQKGSDLFEIEGTDNEGNPKSYKESRLQLKNDAAASGPVPDMVDTRINSAAGARDFEPGYTYRKNALVFAARRLYRAKLAFTAGSLFDPGDWEEIPLGEWGKLIGALNDQADLAAALEKKADKIEYPEVPFTGTFNIDPPRIIRFGLSKHPDLDVSASGGIGFYAWQVLGRAAWMFGFWKDSVHGDGLTRCGLFELNSSTLAEIESIYDGAQWLDLGDGQGNWRVRYGVRSAPQEIGVLNGFSPSPDITIPELPTENLAGVEQRKQDKIKTNFGVKNVVVAEADGGVDALTYGVDGAALSGSAYKFPTSRAAAAAIEDEADNRQAGDIRLQALIDSQAGKGGALTAHDFGSAAPSDEELTLYACQDIWGEGGAWGWNSAVKAESTYTVNGVTHKAGEIFNNTWVRNTYDSLNHRWVLANTPDTNPAVFSWADVGADTVSQANETYAGIAKLYNDLDNENTDGSVTQAALAGALKDAPEADDQADEKKTVHRRGIFAVLGAALPTLTTTAKTLVPAVNELASAKLDIQQSPDDEGKAMVIGNDGRLSPGLSGKVDTVNNRAADGGKNVDTHILLTKAQYAAFEDPPESGLYPGLAGLDVTITDVDYPDGGLMMAPDYAKIESINRITAANGEWTVDRCGFVICRSSSNVTGISWNIIVNNKVVFNHVSNASQGGIVFFTVSKGDVIRIESPGIYGSIGIFCYFIPPKLVQKLPPVIVEGNGSYSLDETETRQVWHDGKPVYRKVFKGNIEGAAGASILRTLAASLVDSLVNTGGWIMLYNSGAKTALGGYSADDGSASYIYTEVNGDVKLVSRSAYARAGTVNNAYEVWAEYTKK